MKIRHVGIVLGISFALSGCASMPSAEKGVDFSLLRLALTSDPATLQAQADQGDGRAQFALGLIYRYGLHHIEANQQQAALLGSEALKRRGNTAITQYIPGINGKPGRTAIINMPKYDVSAAEAGQNQVCADALDHGQVEADSVCGNAQTMQALTELWRQAR